MSELAYRALSIVIYEHAGYLQSYEADRSRARLQCCLAIITDCENDELLVTDSFAYGPTTPAALILGMRRFAELRKVALACIRGLVELPHEDWDNLTLQFRHMKHDRLQGPLTVSLV